ncbi:Monocarboxylate transporter 9 [Armadillidium vulgare]|nr:Monocarboxylate transporter 9 [Armadillidium vulgare]
MLLINCSIIINQRTTKYALVNYINFYLIACIYFPLFGYSILLTPIFNSLASTSKIAWSISLYSFVFNSFSLFVGPLVKEFGWRKVAIVAGILNSLSFLSPVFFTNPDVVLILYPIFGGIGGGTGCTVCLIILSKYFLKRRGFALTFATLGFCVSSFASPLIANYLLEFYGFKGASLIFGALVLHQCIGGALFQPIQRHLKFSHLVKSENNLKKGKLREINSRQDVMEKNFSQSQTTDMRLNLSLHKKNRNDFYLQSVNLRRREDMEMEITSAPSQNQTTIVKGLNFKSIWIVVKKIILLTFESVLTLKFTRVKLICIGAGCISFSNNFFQMWIPFAITNSGYSLESSAWCLSISSIANLAARIVTTVFADRRWFNVIYVYIFSTFLSGLCIGVFSFVEEMKFYLACVSCWGFTSGLCQSLHPLVLISIMGEKLLPAIFGVSSLSIAIMQMILGPVIGIIRDSTHSYIYACSSLRW